MYICKLQLINSNAITFIAHIQYSTYYSDIVDQWNIEYRSAPMIIILTRIIIVIIKCRSET